MARLVLWIAGFIFIAAGLMVLIPSMNWQLAIILIAVGVGILFFLRNG